MEKNQPSNNNHEVKTFNINENLMKMFASSNIITVKDQQKLADVKEFIVDNYNSVPMYRALPIKLFAILGSPEYPTPEAKYWQCKVEAEVHGNELVRDLHNLELMKIKIEKMKFNLTVLMKNAKDSTDDDNKKILIDFDMAELSVLMSEAQFEYMQVAKKIKYRIDEVSDWKLLAGKLQEACNKTGKSIGNYNEMLTNALRIKWNAGLKDKSTPEEDKNLLKEKLKTLEDTFKNPEQKQ